MRTVLAAILLCCPIGCSKAPARAGAADLATSRRDMRGADMRASPDLAVALDLGVIRDMVESIDLAPPPDLAPASISREISDWLLSSSAVVYGTGTWNFYTMTTIPSYLTCDEATYHPEVWPSDPLGLGPWWYAASIQTTLQLPENTTEITGTLSYDILSERDAGPFALPDPVPPNLNRAYLPYLPSTCPVETASIVGFWFLVDQEPTIFHPVNGSSVSLPPTEAGAQIFVGVVSHGNTVYQNPKATFTLSVAQ